MRQTPEFFGDLELSLLYMARRLREALALEKLLTDSAIDYLVEANTYVGGLLIKRELTGAYFYVSPVDEPRARELLVQHRYKPYDKQ